MTTDIHTSARAKFFRRVETLPICIEPDNTIRVWDDVAGHYTTCHSLSVAVERRIVRAAREEEKK